MTRPIRKDRAGDGFDRRHRLRHRQRPRGLWRERCAQWPQAGAAVRPEGVSREAMQWPPTSSPKWKRAAAMETYRTLAAQSIAQHGGRYVVRAGAAELVEGGPPLKTLVIVEFASMAGARMVRVGGIWRGVEGPANCLGAAARR